MEQYEKRKGKRRDVVNRKFKREERIWQENGKIFGNKKHPVDMVELPNRNVKTSIKSNIIRNDNNGMSSID